MTNIDYHIIIPFPEFIKTSRLHLSWNQILQVHNVIPNEEYIFYHSQNRALSAASLPYKSLSLEDTTLGLDVTSSYSRQQLAELHDGQGNFNCRAVALEITPHMQEQEMRYSLSTTDKYNIKESGRFQILIL